MVASAEAGCKVYSAATSLDPHALFEKVCCLFRCRCWRFSCGCAFHFTTVQYYQGSCCSLHAFEVSVVEVSLLAILLRVCVSLHTSSSKVGAARFIRFSLLARLVW